MQNLMEKYWNLKSLKLASLFFVAAVLLAFQTSSFNKVATYKIDADFFVNDKLGNVYIAQNNKLIKTDNNGNKLFEFHDYQYGTLSSVDVSNPFKPTLYFNDFKQIVTLNNKLGLVATLDLSSIGYFDAMLMTTSSDQDFWIFDAAELKLKKLDENGDLLLESNPIIEDNLQPTYMLEYDNKVYLNTGNNIQVFDRFGAYLKTLPINGIQQFQVEGDKLLYCKGQQLWSYNLATLETSNYFLPEVLSIKDLRIHNKRLYILLEEELVYYEI